MFNRVTNNSDMRVKLCKSGTIIKACYNIFLNEIIENDIANEVPAELKKKL